MVNADAEKNEGGEKGLLFLKKKKQKDFFFALSLRSLATLFALGLVATAEAEEKTPAWPHFEIIAYQAETRAELAALRSIGVSAGMLRAHRDGSDTASDPQAAIFRSLGMRFYVENIATDFYSAYHRWQGTTPVNEAFLAAQAQHNANPTSLAPFERTPSFLDQRWRSEIGQRISRLVTSLRADRPLYYDLADEPGIADLSAAWDFDFSRPALQDFCAWLRAQYHSLAALDRAWEKNYRQLRDFMPETTDQALHGNRKNLAPWMDFKAWMDIAFAQAISAGRERVHAADPKALAAIEGAQIPGWGGYDYETLANAVDVMEIYDFGASVAIARAMNPKLITLMTIAGNDPETEAALWRGVLAGMGGAILWDENHALVSSDGRLGPWGRAAAADFAALRGPLGDTLLAAQRQHDPIAILYSPESFRIHWLLDRAATSGDWATRGADAEYRANPQSDAIAAFLHHLGARGLNPTILSSSRIRAGDLQKGGFRILILPETLALSAAEAAAINHFAAGGGLVIASTPPGGFDEHGRRRVRPALDVAPHFLDPMRPDAEKNLAAQIAAAGVLPPFHLATENGKWPDDVTITRLTRASDGGEIIALQRDARAIESPAISVTLTLARACRIEDLRNGHHFGVEHEITFPLDAIVPIILACSRE